MDIVWLFLEKNVGVAQARNAWMDYEEGRDAIDFFALCDRDDIYHPSKIRLQTLFLQNNPSVGLVWTNAIIIDKYGNTTGKRTAFKASHENIMRSLNFTWNVIPSSFIFRKEIIDSFNLKFDNPYPYAEDLVFFLRFSRYAQIANLAEPLLSYRVHQESTTYRKDRQLQRDGARAHLEYNPYKSYWFVAAIIKFVFWLVPVKAKETLRNYVARSTV